MARRKSDRCNVLYLTGDGMKASATSVGGNALAPCPFFERLSLEGITFTSAYAQNSICTPSRTSVFTGVHPLVHGVACHQHRAPLNLPQLSEIFRENGYYTGVVGHYELNRDLSRGWVEQVDESAPGRLRTSYGLWQSSGSRDIGWPSGRLQCTAEESNSHLITDRALHMADSIGALDAPFFLHVSYNDPHPPYFAPPPYDSLVDSARIPLPPIGDEAARPPWHAAALDTFRTAEATEEDIRKLVAVYYGMIAHLNDQMERLFRALTKRELLENTWVIVAADHGDYTGEKGMFSHTESLYECLLHVPLIICPPRNVSARRGLEVGHLVELADLFPTMLSIAGIDVPEYAQGHDLISWINDGAREPLRECVFAQVGDYHGHLGTTLPGGRPECTRHAGLLEGARTPHFAFTRDPDFGDEAYDLRNDPKELVNLLAQSSSGEPREVNKLRRSVDAWHTECVRLREELGILPGYRGFDVGWE